MVAPVPVLLTLSPSAPMLRMLKVVAIVTTSIRFANQVPVIEKKSDFKDGAPGMERWLRGYTVPAA